MRIYQRYCISLPIIILLISKLQCFFSVTHHLFSAATTSTITATQSLTGNQTITSRGGAFVLGFFCPGNSRNFYIGIWFKNVPKQTVVWVANREAPVLDPSSSTLQISNDGNLALLTGRSTTPHWSTNRGPKNNTATVAELLDSGNLVLRSNDDSSSSASSSSNQVIWQSFDHPTDTWLPGAKLGLNKLTGEVQLLASWRSSEDPSPGIYSLSIDPNGSSQFFIRWNRSRAYWSSGIWNGQIFSLVPEMTVNYIYNFSYVTNDRENYFIYSVKNNVANNTTRLVMGLSGQIKQQTWLENSQQWIPFWLQPKEQCNVYSLCGPFSICNQRNLPSCKCLHAFAESSRANWSLGDRTSGCRRITPLNCGSSDGDPDVFYAIKNVELPDDDDDDYYYYHHSFEVDDSEQCASACLRNCSCTAYTYGSSGCSMWIGALVNLRLSPGHEGETLYVRLAASELETSRSRKRAVAGAVAGVVLVAVLVLVGLVLLVVQHRELRKFRKLKLTEGVLVAFRYRDLRRATGNFAHKLGGGGFGTVFKGELPDGTQIAVKELEGVAQGEKQFRAEVSTIGMVQHVNVVRLRGFCSEGPHRLLVYDYMPGGSLEAALFRREAAVMDWGTRYRVAVGVARGLAYLHEECRDRIIHCDVKPENVLLDRGSVAKVGDLGLAKLVGREFSRVLTTMRGTRGYLAPEWLWGVEITEKVDVYSFGMVLFEMVTGRRNAAGGEEVFVAAWAGQRVLGEEGELREVVDGRVVEGMGGLELREAETVLRVALWCVQDEEDVRPSMGDVVKMLEGLLEVEKPPMPRGLRLLLLDAGSRAPTPSSGLVFREAEMSPERSTELSLLGSPKAGDASGGCHQ